MTKTVFDHQDKSIPTYLSALEERDLCFILRLKGNLSRDEIAINRPKMDKIIEKYNLLSKHILCDLKGATDSDTATLATIISRISELGKAGKKVFFFNMEDHLKSIVEISKLEGYLVICGSEEEALKAAS